MNKREQRKRRVVTGIKYLLFLVPFILGMIGHYMAGVTDLSWNVYYSLRLYFFNTDLQEINIVIDIARWTALIATATAFLLFVKSIYIHIVNWMRSFCSNSCSVYGDNDDAKRFLKNLGHLGIEGNVQKPYKTAYHVAFFDNKQDAIELYVRHHDFFDKELGSIRSRGMHKKPRVFLSMKGIPPMAIQKENVTSFSMESNCADVYWSKYFLRNDEKKIAIIGDSELTNQLLEKGLLVNILSEDQGIQYHIWSKDLTYRELHKKLDKVVKEAMDNITFHDTTWTQDADLLGTMDRIILCEEHEDVLKDAAMITSYLPRVHVYVYGRNNMQSVSLFDNQWVTYFGSDDELLTKEIILKEKLISNAKAIHENYCKERVKEGETCPSWEEIGTFKREANVAAANYVSVMKRLHKAGVSLETLTRLEHIRWDRFYYINNWDYAPVRDNDKKLHPDLVPFDELSVAEQKKDLDNVRLALEDNE